MQSIWPIGVFTDNYVWVIEKHGHAAVVDPGDGAAVVATLRARNLRLAAILITHHHRDHTGGLMPLLRYSHSPVYGSAAEPVAGVDRPVADGAEVTIPELELTLEVLAVPGHTAGHVAYLGPDFVFSGDTLFAGGCGRLFEGTAGQMHLALERFGGLSPTTKVYAAHEYTLANLEFAREVEPDNDELAGRLDRIRALRALGHPTLPSTIEEELATNPFLRCDVPTVVTSASRHAGRALLPGAEVFSVVRDWKDRWRVSS